MYRLIMLTVAGMALTSGLVFGQQPAVEIVDTAAMAMIKEEGLKNSQVMEMLSYLTDVYGPRLTWSPEYRRAGDWARGKLKEIGIQNIRYDTWTPIGKGWTLKNFSLAMMSPVSQPLIGYPKAWSPGFREKEADVIFLDVRKPEDFERYRGKLRGKYVLLDEEVSVGAHFEPMAERLTDSALLSMANADRPQGGRSRRPRFPRNLTRQNVDSVFAVVRPLMPTYDSASVMRRLLEQLVAPRKLQFVLDEGAICAINAGHGDGGLMFVQGAVVPQPADVPYANRLNAYDPKAPEIIPQIVMAAEHYNRLIRVIQKGITPRLEMEIDVAWTKADSSFNIIAEIPGTDLKHEIVLVGGHFDSWHAGTGATDDATGTAASMEAMRILQTVFQKSGIRPRRTIRIGLWGGEEQGLIGSREYVSETAPDHENISVYFNHDNGTGRLRGLYLQGNEATRTIFRSWLTAYNDPAAQTLTLQNTGGTDHLSFDGAGVPGFQFIQDPIEYDSRTHHSNMDVYERVEAEDMKQAATLMAVFLYNAAQREAKFPRKPFPEGRRGR